MPQIAHIASLRSLLGHPTPAREWTPEKKIKSIAAAGFNGLATRLTPVHRLLAEAAGIRHLLGYISSDDPDEFSDLIREQKEAGAVHINVQMDNHDTPPAVATRVCQPGPELFACYGMGLYGLGTGRSGYNLTGLPPAWTNPVALQPEIAVAWSTA